MWKYDCGILRETDIRHCYGSQYTCPLSKAILPPRQCGHRYVSKYRMEKANIQNAKSKDRLARCINMYDGAQDVGQCKSGMASMGNISGYVSDGKPSIFNGLVESYLEENVVVVSANIDSGTFYSNLVEISGETNIFAAFDADSYQD